MNEIESIVFCEGYHDREFWQGWLEYLRCTNLGRPAKQSGRVDVRDPWNEKVGDGEFGFCSAGGQFLRVKPCRGDFRKVKKTVAEGWLNREAETCDKTRRAPGACADWCSALIRMRWPVNRTRGTPCPCFSVNGFKDLTEMLKSLRTATFPSSAARQPCRWFAGRPTIKPKQGFRKNKPSNVLFVRPSLRHTPNGPSPYNAGLSPAPRHPRPAQSISRFRTWPVGTRSSAATPSTRSSGRTSNLSKSCARVLTRAGRGGLPKRLVN